MKGFRVAGTGPRVFDTDAECEAYRLGVNDATASGGTDPAVLEMARLELFDSPSPQEALNTLGRDPWRHRTESMRCKTCMWFIAKLPNSIKTHPDQWEIGRCRRHAPTMGGFPAVFVRDWCGDHRIDENKV